MAVSSRGRARVAGTTFILFCISLFLTAYSARNPWTGTVGATAASLFLSPLQSVSSSIHSSILHTWEGYIALVSVRKENEQLRHRLDALEAQNSRLVELDGENQRLRTLLHVVETTRHRGISTRVIGRAPTNWSQSLTVDAGRDQDVKVGLPVLEGNGIVGQVVAVGATSSRVLLITDPASGVDAIVQGSRARGVVQGTGEGCQLEYVLGDEEVKIGDRIITSGMDGVYPKGLLIGVVSDVNAVKRDGGMFQSIAVDPTVDLGRLENLLIIQKISGTVIDVSPELPAIKGAPKVTPGEAKPR